LLPARSGAELSLGRYEQARADVRRAMTLSPRDPQLSTFRRLAGDAELGLGHFDAAIDNYRKAIDAGTSVSYPNLAAAYALSGKMDEAKAALVEARRLNPNLTVKWMRERAPNVPVLFDGVHKAGLAEE
jgi:tetratricopeptide (TPR) repeat protein